MLTTINGYKTPYGKRQLRKMRCELMDVFEKCVKVVEMSVEMKRFRLGVLVRLLSDDDDNLGPSQTVQ
jgi:hypothetical protein